MRAHRVLVTPRSLTSEPRAARDLLSTHGLDAVFSAGGTQPSEQTLAHLLPGCVGWIAGVEPIGQSVLRHATDLRVISRYGSGLSNVDLSAAQARGICVVAAAGANAQGVAELAVALTLDGIRSVSVSAQALREGRWERHQSREIHGLTVVIVGFGAVGQRYAKAMAALGATITAVDPFAATPDIALVRDLAQVINSADVISLHCPPPSGGKHVIGRDELAQTRPGVIIVNTARAELVDDDAMLEGLNSGQVGMYAVDAFRTEPPEPSDLLQHPRVIATPHIGGFTVEATDRTLRASVDNLVKALRP